MARPQHASDARQRRTIAASQSHPYSEDGTSVHGGEHPHSFPSLTSRWRVARDNARFAQRAAMRSLEVVLMALAMLIVPATIQYFVRCLDTLYEVVGRRARTTFDEVGRGKVVVGGGVLMVWHAALIALSYKAIIDKAGNGSRKGGAWGRILGRIVVPLYLVVALAVFLYTLASRLAVPLVLPAGAGPSAPHE